MVNIKHGFLQQTGKKKMPRGIKYFTVKHEDMQLFKQEAFQKYCTCSFVDSSIRSAMSVRTLKESKQ